MKKSLIILLLLSYTATGFTQNINQIITKGDVDRLIKTLSSDEMQGRGTFTAGIDKAATFIANEFKTIGLKPLDPKNGYRQTFYKYQLINKSVYAKIDGEEIDPKNILVTGNTAEILSINESNTPWIKMDADKDFISQYRTITSAGKKQLVLVDVKFVAIFNRLKGMIEKNSLVDEADFKSPKTQPVVFILDKDTIAKTFNVTVKTHAEHKPLFNVAGVIPGKKKAKEVVIFSAHYDHLGIVEPKEGDSIMNGADDDASGTSAVIALAKYYKKLNNNERTLIFVAFTAEEIGGFGAKYFSQQLNPTDVVAMFNIEMIGKDSKFGKNTAFITGYDKSDFGKILQKNLAGTEFTFHPDPYPEQNLFYRSDNATLAALGVPAHTISTDKIDTDQFYHTVNDEYETLDAENILATIKAIAKSAVSMIKGIDTPKRIPKLQN